MALGASPSTLWKSGPAAPAFQPADLIAAASRPREACFVVRDPATGRLGVGVGGMPISAEQQNGVPTFPLVAMLPPVYPEWLGDRSFSEVHGTRFPYVAGAMANGIHTTDITIAMGKAGMLGFFGAAGLGPKRVEEALDRIQAALTNGEPYGSNLIHSPNEPELEEKIVDLYLRRGVRRISAAAYMALSPAVVRYAYTGVKRGADGRIVRQNYVFAKISRPETAGRFMSPAPAEMIKALVAAGKLTAAEAELAAILPVAEDVSVEADSGGHTDNQALMALFPTILSLRDQLAAKFRYARPIRVGAGGGLGTPSAVAAAFQLGAAYVLVGSVHQSAIESGLSAHGKSLLALAGIGDVMMAPAADMFELGVKVQVLKRGTMFGPRATKLYELYRDHDGLEFIPPDEKARLEKEILGRPAEDIWAETKAFFSERDPREVARAEREPKHRMALVFRWYLGLSSKWAIAGEPSRKMDYQIWSGPAMGAFNAWVKGTFLEKPEQRTVVQIARNLLEGAAVVTRAQQLRCLGVPVPEAAFHFIPRELP